MVVMDVVVVTRGAGREKDESKLDWRLEHQVMPRLDGMFTSEQLDRNCLLTCSRIVVITDSTQRAS